ncbi:MAG: dipeptide epimerase [Hyphomonadaceae bacterium]
MIDLTYAFQQWPYREVFRISRSAKSNSDLFMVMLRAGDHVGRGECGILDQYGHTAGDVSAEFDAAADRLAQGASREEVLASVGNSSARNALDCAFWDLECKTSGRSIWSLVGLEETASIECDLTIGINPPVKMHKDALAAAAQGYRILKVKVGREGIEERVAAVHQAAPGARLVVDANEAWDLETLKQVAPRLVSLNVALIEQPLHHERDAGLNGYRGPIPVCADESCRSVEDLDVIRSRYQAINIKLDKVGGLSDGLALARAAKAAGMGLMLGCHGPTSLGAAPAYLIASLADFVDLDGPALLLEDRAASMTYADGRIFSFTSQLWG